MKFWSKTLPLAITLAWRLIPERVRCVINPRPDGTSHLALEAIRAGGGWAAFWHYALPGTHGGPFDPNHYSRW